MSEEIKKPKFPEGASSWWNLRRSEMTDEQKEMRRKYDRELRAFHRLDPIIKQRDNLNYKNHVYKNKETVYERNSNWRRDNWDAVYKQRVKSGSQARGMNRWYHNKGKHDINHVITERLRCRIRNTITKGYKSAPTLVLLGCDIESFKIHLKNQFTEGMSWDNYGEWHIDHIKPCCSFDLSVEENQRECFHYSNLRPLWGGDNLSKSKQDKLQSIKNNL